MVGDAVVFLDDTVTYDSNGTVVLIPEGTIGLVVQRRDELRTVVVTDVGCVVAAPNHIRRLDKHALIYTKEYSAELSALSGTQ